MKGKCEEAKAGVGGIQEQSMSPGDAATFKKRYVYPLCPKTHSQVRVTRWSSRNSSCYTQKLSTLRTRDYPALEMDDELITLAELQSQLIRRHKMKFKLKQKDSHFYDFHNQRMETSFKKAQVWAIYDDDDGMPRHYALIQQLTLNPFHLKISWLDILNHGDPTLLSTGFHVSCGTFKLSNQTTTLHSSNIFSHLVASERAATQIYRIFPTKGSVWALYKHQQSLEPGKKTASKPTYNIAVLLTTYTEMHGFSMAYLQNLHGYNTIFKRREMGYHAIRCFRKDDIKLFSHQIPARKLSVDEALGHLKDCWELDPASLPSDLLPTCASR